MLKRLYYILLQRIYVIRNRNKLCQGKVYMFHEIKKDDGIYSIDKESFRSFLDWLLENKKIVDLKTMMEEKNGNNVVITFDDAYDSVYNYAFSILKERNVPYHVFVCNDLLGKEGYLDEKMIKEMIDESKCIIGSHGYYHELSRFKEKDVLKKELEKSKRELEERFDINVQCMAFPFGSIYACSDENAEDAKELFDVLCMTYSLPYNDCYGNVVPRMNINGKNYKDEMK